MKGTKYLSQIGLKPERFKKMKINLIECPTGAGKTHFAFNQLPTFTQSNYCILYLTDTNMNREQILSTKENTVSYSQSWRELLNQTPKEVIVNLHKNAWGSHAETKITVMNYAQAGAILHHNHPFDWSKFDFVVCDELQNLIKWQNIIAKDENGKRISVNILHHTQRKIEHTLYNTDTIIIALTATPDKIRKVFKNVYYVLEPQEYKDLFQHEEKHILKYTDHVKILSTIPQGKRGIIFFYHIGQLKKAEELLTAKGHKTASIWSMANKSHEMTEKQTEIRKHIIQNEEIPPSIDILLINSACETGININNTDLDFILVHSTDSDTIKQVRGRLRQDLNELYILFKDIPDMPNPVPAEYLNRPLTAKEKETLCTDMIRYLSPKGQPYKWKAVRPYLESNGYKITEATIKNVRHSIIEKL